MKWIADFRIAYRQYLNENAELVTPLPDFAQNNQILIDLYRWMTLVRAYDTKAIALQRTGKIGTYPSILGQEAVSVAIGRVMRSEDVFVPFYRDMGAQLQRGMSMSQVYQYWGGDERGNAYPHYHDDLPISVPIASQCLHGCGIALAIQMRQQDRVVVVSCGDGATSQGDFYEALNVAGVWQLPIVFVINNNQWAISVPLKKQTHAQTLAQKAIAAGFEGIQVDGNDVIAVYQVVQEALDKARDKKGPTLIEAVTYRSGHHTTADDASRYRTEEEERGAWKKEPIQRLRLYLTKIQRWDENQELALQESCAKSVVEAVHEYSQYKPQALSSLFDYHYASWPSSLLEQKQQAERGVK